MYPVLGSVRAVQNAIEDPSGEAYENWKTANRGYINDLRDFEKYQPQDKPPTKISEDDWNEVIDSVWLSGEKYMQFKTFFLELHNVRTAVDSLPDFKTDVRRVRIRPLLKKMVPNARKSRKEADLDNYKGACCELLDVFRTMQFRNPDVVKIAVPKGHKKFETEDVAHYLLVKPKDADATWKPLMEQDIDRTEVQNGSIKYYIEVKSDVHTAVQKHQKTTDQLDRIIAVVKNRMRKPDNKLDRRPAVSIVNPDGWLELFTTNTARNYCKRQFWLFIDNMLISPQTLESVDKDVWSKACPGVQYGAKPDAKVVKLLDTYFEQEKANFPKPSVKIKI